MSFVVAGCRQYLELVFMRSEVLREDEEKQIVQVRHPEIISCCGMILRFFVSQRGLYSISAQNGYGKSSC